jgi:hypothetical protein
VSLAQRVVFSGVGQIVQQLPSKSGAHRYSAGMKERFFEVISKEGKIAYIPLSQLLRIEAFPGGGIFLNFSESFQVNVEIADGGESEAVKSLYNELTSVSSDPIRLNPETLNITHIHF